MPQVVIENPILNSPFEEPTRHFRFSDDGITDEIVAARTLWVPAVNNNGGFGRWAFLEVTDPWNAEGQLRSAVARLHT
jgi:hypothetical protein